MTLAAGAAEATHGLALPGVQAHPDRDRHVPFHVVHYLQVVATAVLAPLRVRATLVKATAPLGLASVCLPADLILMPLPRT
jgi:hypothetical protein